MMLLNNGLLTAALVDGALEWSACRGKLIVALPADQGRYTQQASYCLNGGGGGVDTLCHLAESLRVQSFHPSCFFPYSFLHLPLPLLDKGLVANGEGERQERLSLHQPCLLQILEQNCFSHSLFQTSSIVVSQ